MKAPFGWLTELVEIKSSAEELAKKLSLISIGVDKVDHQNGEAVLDIDVTYNRGDLLSMVGLAYEVSFIERSRTHLAPLETDLNRLPQLTDWRIKRDEKSCPLYVLVLLKLKNKPSPEWMRKRLTLMSNQPRGIIVDAANYVMWEYGQPFHTFDAAKLKMREIRVQPAGKELGFTTLDGKKRRLAADDILILDGQKPIALAGVMGGEETEISDGTELVLLEMALFNPYQIRKTAMRQGLFSDAANHFIHRPSSNTSMLALRRILDLYQKYAQAEIQGIRISGQTKVENPKIKISLKDITKLIGLDIPSRKVKEILEGLYFQVKAVSEDSFLVQAPHWRSDVRIKEDVIEEVIRGFGYWRLRPTPLPLEFLPHREEGDYYADLQLKNFLTGQGLYQLNNFGFFSQEEQKGFKLKPDELVEVTNPISNEARYLKTTLVPGLVLYLQENTKKPLPLVKPKGVFEINTVYPLKASRRETQTLGLAITEFAYFNQLVNSLFLYLHLDYGLFDVQEKMMARLSPLSSGLEKVITLFYGGQELGVIGRSKGVWFMELDYNLLLKKATLQPVLSEEVKFSPWIEDLTFEVGDEIELVKFLLSITKIDRRINEVTIINTFKNRISLRLAYLDKKKQLSSLEAAQLRRRVVDRAAEHHLHLIGQL